MKKGMFLLVGIVFAIMGMAQQNWSTIALTEKVTISMPGTPKVEDRGGRKTNVSKLADSSSFLCLAIDFSAMGLSEEVLASMAPTEEFKEQFKTGLLQSTPNANIISDKIITVLEKYTAYDFEIETEEKGKKTKRFSRVVFYKSFAITINYSAGLNGPNVADKDKYFNSLKIEG